MKSDSHGCYCNYSNYDIDHEINLAVNETIQFAKKQAERAESKKDRRGILKAISTTIVDMI